MNTTVSDESETLRIQLSMMATTLRFEINFSKERYAHEGIEATEDSRVIHPHHWTLGCTENWVKTLEQASALLALKPEQVAAPAKANTEAPKQIWLQINPEGNADDTGYPDDHDHVTWCWHSIGGQEVRYVRADLAQVAAQGEPVLSSRLRSGVECAPRVIDEVKKLEALIPKPGELLGYLVTDHYQHTEYFTREKPEYVFPAESVTLCYTHPAPVAQVPELREELQKIIDMHGHWSNGIYAANIARSLLQASPKPQELLPGPSGDVLSDFQDGQWWLVALDEAVANGTCDQKRAVAVVRNLLRTIAVNFPELDEPQEPEAKLTLENAPIGTKAPAFTGGHWVRNARGWKWCTGATFPRPGGDWTGELIAPDEPQEPVQSSGVQAVEQAVMAERERCQRVCQIMSMEFCANSNERDVLQRAATRLDMPEHEPAPRGQA